MANTFTAQYRSECADCPVDIEVGDEIVGIAGTYAHAVCSERDEGPAACCPRCFLALPKTGVCGVCDD